MADSEKNKPAKKKTNSKSKGVKKTTTTKKVVSKTPKKTTPKKSTTSKKTSNKKASTAKSNTSIKTSDNVKETVTENTLKIHEVEKLPSETNNEPKTIYAVNIKEGENVQIQKKQGVFSKVKDFFKNIFDL